jgi:kumamolisin
MQRAFGVDLKIYQHATTGQTYRGRVGDIYVPEELHDIVTSVHGLDNREQAVPHFRIIPQARPSALKKGPARANAAGPTAFTPNQVAALYDFPDATGKDQTIAVIELGGGFRKSDLQHYFRSLGITPPSVTAVSVHGATNHPTGDPNGDDGEVVLDIEVMGAIAFDTKIAVYFAHNTDKGFLDAITAAVHDTKRKPSIVSISWGKAEIAWSQQSIDAFNEVFKEAALLGISVLVASGDDGSNDNVNDGQNHVDFPSSSPFALACGGTKLIASSPTTIQQEVCWGGTGDGASGGGVSDVFDTPSYQQNGITPPLVRRGVPDVAGNADPETGYQVFVDGVSATVGGTSAVAPLYAALIAQLNEKIGARCGQLHAFLYNNPNVCRDITAGTNGSFTASAGWDATTGLGSIKGNDLLARLTSAKRKAA